MRLTRVLLLALCPAGACLGAGVPGEAKEPWKGVDETVVARFAEAGGRPARTPYINTDQGDLLLFAFLVSGAAAGFMAGYGFRALFPPKRSGDDAR